MALRDSLDERSRRLSAAAESIAIGRGGITAVAEATGMSRSAIRLGLRELREPAAHPPNRIRRPGGGRKKTVTQDPSLLRDLERLIEPLVTRNAQGLLSGGFGYISTAFSSTTQLAQPRNGVIVARFSF